MTRLDYGQFLLSSQVNDTLTYFADHSEKLPRFSHRYLRRRPHIHHHWTGTLSKSDLILRERLPLLTNTVLDKRHSFNIQAVRRQWSGNAGQVIKASGL
jgi:hypothetical protein